MEWRTPEKEAHMQRDEIILRSGLSKLYADRIPTYITLEVPHTYLMPISKYSFIHGNFYT
jgi:hypothetical protein